MLSAIDTNGKQRRNWLPLVWACLLCRPASCGLGAEALRLGYFPNLTHAQALYARATGAFTNIGVRVEWTSFNAGPTAIESLLTDAVDASFIGPSPTINGYTRSKGEKFVVVAGSASGGAGLVVRKHAGIANERDFGGKVIATPQLGNTQDVAARVWFAEHGYRLRERGGNVSLVPLSNADQLTMFRKRQIDGAWTIEPWLSRLEIEGGGTLFLDEKTLWPNGRYVTTHLVVTKSYLTDHEKIVRNLIAALIDVTRQINSDRAAAIPILNEQLKKETGRALHEQVIQTAMTRLEFTWDPICASLKKSAESVHKVHLYKAPPDLKGLYALNHLNEVLRGKDLPPVAVETP